MMLKPRSPSPSLKLTKGTGRFLLESVEQGYQRSRYSFIGWHPLLTLKATGSLLTVSEKEGSFQINGEPLAEIYQQLSALRVVLCGTLTPFSAVPSGISVTIMSDRFINSLPTGPVLGMPDL